MEPITRADYWEHRYEAGDAPWDLAQPAPALMNWLASEPRPGRVLVPGSGRGHDALALARAGFAVTGVDFAPSAVAAAKEAAAREGLEATFLEADLFALDSALDGTFDWLFEHTCFCAIDPAQREAYVKVARRLLKPGGSLVGVFYTHGKPGGPPFDVRPEALESLFSPGFEIVRLEPVKNSVPMRLKDETWGVFARRD